MSEIIVQFNEKIIKATQRISLRNYESGKELHTRFNLSCCV